MSETVTLSPSPVAVVDPQAVQLNQAAQLSQHINASTSDIFVNALNSPAHATDTTHAGVNAELNTAEGAGLLALNSSSLAALNEFGTDPRNASVTGALTPQQLHGIDILREDAARLEEASVLTAHTPLEEAATTVELSAQAQGIAGGFLPTPALSADAQIVAGTNTVLTTAQLAQIGRVLAPLANEPLSAELFTQIQTQVANAGFSPLQFSMRTIFLALHYVAGLLPHTQEASSKGAVRATEDMDTEMTVQPVSATQAAAVDNDTLREQA